MFYVNKWRPISSLKHIQMATRQNQSMGRVWTGNGREGLSDFTIRGNYTLGMGEKNYWAGEVGLVRWGGVGDKIFRLEKHSSNTYIRQEALCVVHIVRGFSKPDSTSCWYKSLKRLICIESLKPAYSVSLVLNPQHYHGYAATHSL